MAVRAEVVEGKARPKFRVGAFWQAVLVVAAAYLLFEYAFPPVMPRTLMVQFMVITVLGTLLYYSSDEERWSEFKAPILAVLREDRTRYVRWALLVVIPLIVAYAVYDSVRPKFDAPVELRQVHPAPPSTLRLYDKRFDLARLENPVRKEILAQFRADPDAGMASYEQTVGRGAQTYFTNCFFCHGDQLDGEGHLAQAFTPLPANFQDVGTIAQLQEAFLFWRIATGGPGLPREGAPWNSAMPVWHEYLEEDEIWSLIVFLYDYVGQVPRMWDPQTSRTVTGMKDRVRSQRAGSDGKAIYQHRCAVCHGEQGLGDGPAAEYLYPRPRDFSLALFKYKTSPGTLPPRDQDLFDTIKHGLGGTGMPGWSGVLSDAQIRALVPVIKGFDITLTWAPEDAPDEAFDSEGRYTKEDFVAIAEEEPTDGRVEFSAESLARGKERFAKACKECHGEEGRGNITSGKRLEDDWGYRIWPRDLTRPWTWRVSNAEGTDAAARDATIANIYTRLSIGIPGTPMPAHRAVEEGNEDPLSLEDRWHVANYVYSLRERAPPPPTPGAVIRGVRLDGALPDGGDDPRWDDAPAVTLRLAPNVIKGERLFTPLVGDLTVRLLYNDEDVAFLLETGDRTDSRPGEETSEQIQDGSLEMAQDAFAIQLPKEGAFAASPVVEKPLYRHGDKAHPTTIWYWSAGSVEPPAPPRVAVFDASGPDSALSPRPADGEPLAASGAWAQGRWRVVFTRPRSVAETGDVRFDEGRFVPVSFANWDGSNGESGSRHTLTGWTWLLLPPEVNLAGVYGAPVGAGLLVFAAGLLLVRSQRRKVSPPAGTRPASDDSRDA